MFFSTVSDITHIMQYIFDILSNLIYFADAMKNIKMKIARVEKDLTQEELAERVGVTRQTIGMIESGNYNPSLNLCIDICKALNKTLNDLFWEEPTTK